MENSPASTVEEAETCPEAFPRAGLLCYINNTRVSSSNDKEQDQKYQCGNRQQNKPVRSHENGSDRRSDFRRQPANGGHTRKHGAANAFDPSDQLKVREKADGTPAYCAQSYPLPQR